MSYTFALIKPDAVANPITLRYISEALFFNRIRVAKGCRLKLSREQAIRLYSIHKNNFFYLRLIRHVCSGTSILMKLESIDELSSTKNDNLFSKMFKFIKNTESSKPETNKIVKQWRNVLGPSKLFQNLYTIDTSIEESSFCNLRQYFALSDTRNVGHASDSLENRKNEIAIFETLMHDVDNVNVKLFHLNKFSIRPEKKNLFV